MRGPGQERPAVRVGYQVVSMPIVGHDHMLKC